VILLCLYSYGAGRVIARWPAAAQHGGIAWSVAALLFLVPFVGPVADRRLAPRWRHAPGFGVGSRMVDGLSYGVFGVLSILIPYELAVDLVMVPWKWLAGPVDAADFDLRILLGLSAAVGATVAIGLWQAARRPGVQRVEIPLRNLPPSFDGFRIVQVSDLHVGPLIRARRTREVVALVNGLQADLVALTGDFVDGSVRDLASELAPLAELKARHGVFYVTGNHEFYWNAVEWMQEFRRLGARVLVNEHELIVRGGAAIVLAGVSDYSSRALKSPLASDPARALAGAPAGLTRILLAHQPASYLAAQAAGFELQLSGHTHAGQYFPFNLLVRYFQRYYKGLNRYAGMWLYVSRGTGYWGPPLRAGVPAEITLITLRREGASPSE
jgi:predicted MPP superfamily phosphohydrolase